MRILSRLAAELLAALLFWLGWGAGLGWVSTKSWLEFFTTLAVICAASAAALAVGMEVSEEDELGPDCR